MTCQGHTANLLQRCRAQAHIHTSLTQHSFQYIHVPQTEAETFPGYRQHTRQQDKYGAFSRRVDFFFLFCLFNYFSILHYLEPLEQSGSTDFILILWE